jgi:hypothetical protein
MSSRVDTLSRSDRSKFTNWRYWNIDSVGDDSTVALFGPRGCGKTTLMRHILRRKNFNRGLVMCPTPEAFQTYSEFIPPCFIYDEFDEDVLANIMAFQKLIAYRVNSLLKSEVVIMIDRHQRLRKEQWISREKRLIEYANKHQWTEEQIQTAWVREIAQEKFLNAQNESSLQSFLSGRRLELRKPKTMFLLLDDMSSYKPAMNSEILKKIINNGRHYLLFLIFAVQYAADFPCGCRGGLDWVIVFFDTIQNNVKRLFEMYVGIFPSREAFDIALKDASTRGCALVIRKNNPSPLLEDSVFLLKNERTMELPTYLGDPCWEYVHNMFFDNDKYINRIVEKEKSSNKKGASGSGSGNGNGKSSTGRRGSTTSSTSGNSGNSVISAITSTKNNNKNGNTATNSKINNTKNKTNTASSSSSSANSTNSSTTNSNASLSRKKKSNDSNESLNTSKKSSSSNNASTKERMKDKDKDNDRKKNEKEKDNENDNDNDNDDDNENEDEEKELQRDSDEDAEEFEERRKRHKFNHDLRKLKKQMKTNSQRAAKALSTSVDERDKQWVNSEEAKSLHVSNSSSSMIRPVK